MINNQNLKLGFIKEPVSFNKYTEKNLLAYCLGATLYMPAIRNFADIIIKNKMPNLASMVICFEDAIDESQLPQAEKNAIENINMILQERESGTFDEEQLPLVFIRVRSPQQFSGFVSRLNQQQLSLLTGFVFPKFSSNDGEAYFSCLESLNKTQSEILYGMPILESKTIAINETREQELLAIKKILDAYKPLVLNVRVGATDFSACFGVRRGIDYSIYDILTVRECLTAILNVFNRNSEYVISGPVWEYFLASKNMKFSETLEFSLQSSLLKRKRLVNEAVDGLLREVILDKANGFVGKTVIHPTHVKYVNVMQAVTEEEYNDALQVLNTSGGVIKSEKANKMNEINPHRSWAQKIYYKAQAYGVIKDEASCIKLVAEQDFDE